MLHLFSDSQNLDHLLLFCLTSLRKTLGNKIWKTFKPWKGNKKLDVHRENIHSHGYASDTLWMYSAGSGVAAFLTMCIPSVFTLFEAIQLCIYRLCVCVLIYWCGRFLQGPSRLQLSKPLIAAVSGFAVAGGLELALLADLRVVEESAVMGVFCRRFGKSDPSCYCCLYCYDTQYCSMLHCTSTNSGPRTVLLILCLKMLLVPLLLEAFKIHSRWFCWDIGGSGSCLNGEFITKIKTKYFSSYLYYLSI